MHCIIKPLMLVTIVQIKQDCVKELLKPSQSQARSLISSGDEFQTVGLAIKKADSHTC